MRSNLRFLKSIFLSKIKNTPYKLNFAITAVCNSNCLTCNVGREYKKNPEIVKNELSLKEIATIFRNLPSTITWLSFSGGEPFLRRDFFKIISLAIQEIPNLSIISIPSNGLDTTGIMKTLRKVLALKSLPQLFVNFSLDGPSIIHNKIRGVENAYAKTQETYKQVKTLFVKRANLHINLEVTISSLNIDYLNDFCTLLVNQGEKITATVVHNGYIYKSKTNTPVFIGPNQADELKQVIKTINKNLSWFSPPELVEKIYLKKMLFYIQSPKKQILSCTALSASCALDPFGEVTPCFMWGKKLGNIRHEKGNLAKILNKPSVQEAVRQISRNKCPNCWTPCEAYQAIIWAFLTGRWHLIK